LLGTTMRVFGRDEPFPLLDVPPCTTVGVPPVRIVLSDAEDARCLEAPGGVMNFADCLNETLDVFGVACLKTLVAVDVRSDMEADIAIC